MEPKELSVFPIGGKNDAYAQYFVGQSYLNMLTTQGIGNVTFAPGCRNNWQAGLDIRFDEDTLRTSESVILQWAKQII